MRPIWKGFIAFGLVSIPVKLYPATESKSITFSLIHQNCGGPIHYKKYCNTCNREVSPEEIIKGYEFSRGQFVTFTEEELEALPKLKGRKIEILDFVNLAEVDPIYLQKSYYLTPSEGGEKPYALLMQALKDSKKIAIAKMVLRTKENIAMVRVFKEKVLTVSTIFYPDEIRKFEIMEIPEAIPVEERELSLAKMLIDSLTTPFNPEKYKDTYREALMEVIEKKIQHEAIVIPEEKVPAKVIDLTEALRLSLEKITGEKVGA
ncbi:Ku protein [Carboxydothermus islandicus]|uniref:Non-homologous end joining protein Ku n=1 Tax=Carboxydothermus islandicus TaxID=661089 RepID=A0A1L8D191_9THEO|nr:Ku protein [Carboxydothermus islandicus]GAV24909.1 Ku protein [Carboxydothermus islandicus]